MASEIAGGWRVIYGVLAGTVRSDLRQGRHARATYQPVTGSPSLATGVQRVQGAKSRLTCRSCVSHERESEDRVRIGVSMEYAAVFSRPVGGVRETSWLVIRPLGPL
jgi:hypothetical protein